MAPEKEDDFASMLAEFEKQHPSPRKRKEPKLGEVVRGRVVTLGADAVFIDLGAKAEGMIDVAQLRDDGGKLTVAVGDEVEARVVETSGKAGCIVLHPLGAGHVAKAELEQAFSLGLPVDGVVAAVNKGGVEVTVAGVRAFCPISQLDVRHVEDAAAFVGQRLTFKITRYEERGKNLVLSRRALLEEEQRRLAADTRARLAPGVVLRGKVASLQPYGAFIDLGGIEGMVHVSELGFARVAHPKELLSVGQEVEVAVLRIDKGDDPRKPEKIALSIKSLERDPWDDIASRFPEGTRAAGKVARVESFGAFVELAPGVEGLVHVSELGAGRKVNHPREVVKPGQAVEVTVLGADRERRRISLSMAAPGGADLDEERDVAAVPRAPERLGTLADLFGKAAARDKGKRK
jgi:small subunit ribosomal protein S1